MPMIASFHEVQFPLRLAFGSTGGPIRKTEIVTLGSGHEQRDARWSQSRRRFEVGQAARTVDDLYEILSFFEERKGRLFGFRFRDPFDWKSCPPGDVPLPTDQPLGTGDGVNLLFPLLKELRTARRLAAPRRHSRWPPRCAARSMGAELAATADFTVNSEDGEISILAHAVPAPGAVVTAGYEFDIPVRFDSDEISINLAAFQAGEIPSLHLLEILP